MINLYKRFLRLSEIQKTNFYKIAVEKEYYEVLYIIKNIFGYKF